MWFRRLPRTLHVHAGAHKTATTHLQATLASSASTLSGAGVACTLPPDSRQGWLRRLRGYSKLQDPQRRARRRRELAGAAPRCALWLISDENLGGRPAENARSRLLYPELDRHLGSLLDIYRPRRMQLFFSVRSYDDYFRSSYLEWVRNHGYHPFRDHHDDMLFEQHSWLELVRRVHERLPEARITLWRYEDFSAVRQAVLDALVGRAGLVTPPAGTVEVVTRPSLSAAALEALSRLPVAAKREDNEQQALEQMARFPIGPDHPPYQPWRPHQAQALQDRYLADLAAIRETLPALHWIEPETAVRTPS